MDVKDKLKAVDERYNHIIAGDSCAICEALARITELESQIAAKGKQEWISVKDACNDYMQFIRSDEFHEDKIGDYENTIFETALIQVYGPDVFDEINSKFD